MNEHYKNVYAHALETAAKTGFTAEQIAEIAPAMELVLEKAPDAFAELEKAVAECRDNADMVYALTRTLGLEDDFGMLAVCLLLTHVSHRVYREKGIDEEVYLDSMKDIRVWTQTCIENRYHLGVYQYGWIRHFYTADIVRLGRLEFHIVEYHHNEPYTACGVTVQKGDPVINTHIPADGHMEPEDVQDSFRRAYRYFGKTGITPIVCHSLLLNPGNRYFCKPDSRMAAFMDCFTILESEDIPDSGDLWRVFGHRPTYDPDTLPEDTPLRRQLKEHLKNGGTMGEGYGILLHDGEKRVDEPVK
ncbi:MAG: DUF5596 domain-containing protein [Clostridia bacterium]|nr:DUF5596 domain-containing protein [Clostridia bacterium]